MSNPRSAAARTSFQNPCSPLGGWPDSVIWHHQCAEGDGASAVWERASEAFAAMRAAAVISHAGVVADSVEHSERRRMQSACCERLCDHLSPSQVCTGRQCQLSDRLVGAHGPIAHL